jgi:hypothetical protein
MRIVGDNSGTETVYDRSAFRNDNAGADFTVPQLVRFYF